MLYKNPHPKRVRRAFILDVFCLSCKKSFCLYQKKGKGGLIKLQIHRVLEANFPFSPLASGLFCPSCGVQLGSLADHKGRPCYFLLRGRVGHRKV